VRERLEAEVRISQADLMPWLPLIAIVVDVPVPSTTEVEQLAPDARASKLREVVLGFLTRSLVVPTIVEVEHAHLMDAASVGLFEALTRELESSSWVVLVTRRDQAGGLALADDTYPRLELTALCPEDAQALALLTPEASRLPPHVLELAVERSGGSPEFLLDLLAAAAAGDREELPESVGAATMARTSCRRTWTFPRRASGTDCRECSLASPMATSASGAPRSRRLRTRASRSSCGASCTWQWACG
jgi:hypothetical protein